MEPHDHPHPHEGGHGHGREHPDKSAFDEELKKKTPDNEQQVMREVYHHHHERRRGFSLWRLFWGCAILLIGFSLLADQLGWNISFEFWKFWPVFIIFIGLSMLGRGSWVNTVLGILVGLTVIGIVLAGMFGAFSSTDGNMTTGSASIVKEAAATEANVSLSFGTGTLLIAGGDTDLLSYSYSLKNGAFAATSDLRSTT